MIGINFHFNEKSCIYLEIQVLVTLIYVSVYLGKMQLLILEMQDNLQKTSFT